MSRRSILIGLALVGVACGVILAFVGQTTGARALGVLLTVSNSFLARRYFLRED
jgi:ABC-type Mn2+/Zn2+ transport system permease subunit